MSLRMTTLHEEPQRLGAVPLEEDEHAESAESHSDPELAEYDSYHVWLNISISLNIDSRNHK